MKTNVKNLGFIALAGLIGLGFASCQDDNEKSFQPEYATLLSVDDDGTSMFVTEDMVDVLDGASALESDEEDGLLFMLEEEKLARDLYIALNTMWNHQSFAKISIAEEKHMQAVQTLIFTLTGVQPEIADQGVFNNQELAELYSALISKGSESLISALAVGALVEETDIEDLMVYLLQSPSSDIVLVYENLLKGSRNHLRAFAKQLDANGVTYVPEVLDSELYNEIISSAMENGKKYRKHNNKGNGGKGKGGNGNGSCNR